MLFRSSLVSRHLRIASVSTLGLNTSVSSTVRTTANYSLFYAPESDYYKWSNATHAGVQQTYEWGMYGQRSSSGSGMSSEADASTAVQDSARRRGAREVVRPTARSRPLASASSLRWSVSSFRSPNSPHRSTQALHNDLPSIFVDQLSGTLVNATTFLADGYLGQHTHSAVRLLPTGADAIC